MLIKNDWYLRFILWRERNITEKNFILILSLLTGLLGGMAALLLKWAIHFIQDMLTSHFSINNANYLYLLYPVVGILISGIYVRYLVKDDIIHGVTCILYAISQ